MRVSGRDEERERAAAAAVQHVRDGMIVGLGSGDTATRAIRQLGARVQTGLHIIAVATSEASAELGRSLGINVRTPDDVARIDLTIDGADEIDPQLHLIKGGGAAHTREKLVAQASAELIIVVDADKRVQRLGEKMRLPVEVLTFGARWTLDRLRRLGLDPRVRAGVKTDNGNLIADCVIPPGMELHTLANELDRLTGVVEHGLFLDEATLAYIGEGSEVTRLSRLPRS
jgi:ribose 5-phosphate isomerase A